MHLFGHRLDHDYYFELLREEERAAPLNYSVFDCTPSPVPELARVRTELFDCS